MAHQSIDGESRPCEVVEDFTPFPWTNERPSKSGFYWFCSEDDGAQLVEVVRGDDRIFVYTTERDEPFEIEDSNTLNNMAWSGPFEPPPPVVKRFMDSLAQSPLKAE